MIGSIRAYKRLLITDVVASPWQSNHETNQKLRQVTYTLTLPPNSFGPKVSHVTETQVRRVKPGFSFLSFSIHVLHDF